MRVSQYPMQLTLKLSEDCYSLIKQISDDKEISMGELIRDLLSDSLAELEQQQS